MLETTLLNYKIKCRTQREKHLRYLEELRTVFRGWNIPDDAIERIFRYSVANGLLREKEHSSYKNLEEQVKTMLRVYCEPHIVDLQNDKDCVNVIEYDDTGDPYPAQTVTEYVDGELNGQRIWYPKTMYMTEDDGGKISFYEDASLQAKNDRRLVDVYRAVNGLLTSCEIKAFCGSVCLSERTLSLLLGWEIDAIDRYCNDEVQSVDRNQTLVDLIENRDLLLSYIEVFDDDMVELDEDELIESVATVYGHSCPCK